MKSRLRPVVFVAFEEYDHLGIGYLCAMLSKSGFETRVIDFRYNNNEILELVKKLDPMVIGFSIIYQYYIDQFQKLIGLLRKEGIRCHFTTGGHYASLRYEELFELIPSIDSVVRFEGEYTLLNLTKCIYSGVEWRNIRGIVYKSRSKIIVNPHRELENDLDKFPFPMRSPLIGYAFDRKFATILAGRGCIYNCSYCSSKEYYKQVPGPAKRLRSPEMVVREMELLYREKGCSIFLFQDDDFPVKTIHGSDWIIRFCRELKRKRLSNKIMWKINCRPDEIDEENFEMMKRSGLFLVFLGIEDGTDTGLKRLNRHMTVIRNLEGINTLKKLGIVFDYGFMIFQPSSRFQSINENLDFLRQICSDGYTPVIFTKLLPYFETQVEKELEMEGRLKGTAGFLDYDFYDESLNRYYDFINENFAEWLKDTDGLVNISKWARNYFSVYLRYFGTDNHVVKLRRKLTRITSESNLFLLDTMKELSMLFESGKYLRSNNILKNYGKNIKLKRQSFEERIHKNVEMLLLHEQASR